MQWILKMKGRRFWIGVAFFLFAAAPGCWVPALANVLRLRGWSEWLALAFLLPQIASVISPLAFAAKADQSCPAEKVLAWTLAGGSVLLFAAFWCLGHLERVEWFLILLFLNCIVSAPIWSLLVTIALSNLKPGGGNFGFFRVWGSAGWLAGGWLISALKLDFSAGSGLLASAIRVLAGLVCLLLPHTPPRGQAARSWRSVLGLDAFKVLLDREVAVYFATAFLFSVPIQAHFMHTPLMLLDLGLKKVSMGMTAAQGVEVLAMLSMGLAMAQLGVRWMLVMALFCGVARYIFYAVGASWGSWQWALLGVGLNGICWAYFFEAGRVFVDGRVARGLRAQTQALLALTTSGVGGMLGTLSVNWLYQRMVVGGHGGWGTYWWTLTGMSLLALGVFFLGGRGKTENG